MNKGDASVPLFMQVRQSGDDGAALVELDSGWRVSGIFRTALIAGRGGDG